MVVTSQYQQIEPIAPDRTFARPATNVRFPLEFRVYRTEPKVSDGLVPDLLR